MKNGNPTQNLEKIEIHLALIHYPFLKIQLKQIKIKIQNNKY